MARVWTPAEDRRLALILGAGNDLAEACCRLMTSFAEVERRARELGLAAGPQPEVEEAPAAECAPETNIIPLPARGIERRTRRAPRADDWSEAEVARLAGFRDAGDSAATAGRALGRTEQACLSKAKQLWGGWRAMKHWTAAEDERLAALARGGISAREIAAAMGRGRNDVLGRAHRIFGGLGKLAPVTRSNQKTSATAREAVKKIRARRAGKGRVHSPSPPRVDLLVCEPVDASGVPMAAVGPHHCRWIHGDPAADEPTMCGQPVTAAGESWCASHRRRVFGASGPALEAVA